jgi:hypothetical protein
VPDFFANVDRLALAPVGKPVANREALPVTRGRSQRVQGEFVKGPLPMTWLTTASKLPGKAPLAVGLALWFEAGRRRSMTVTLTTAILARFGVQDRKAKYRGLCALEQAGLIAVVRVPRRNPVVTILDAQDSSTARGHHHQQPEREEL